jgi:hypothetical protein
MVSPRRNQIDLDIHAIDAPLGMHVQHRHEAASHQPGDGGAQPCNPRWNAAFCL